MKFEVVYPEKPEAPIFPKAESWFKWEQRYVYEDVDSGEIFFLDGYGKIHRGFDGWEPQVFLNSKREVVSVFYQKLKPYNTNWEYDREGWSWILKGSGKLIFDEELVSFDYPLVLGKRWVSEGKLGEMSLESRGVVVAYISPEGEVKVADGFSYKPSVKPLQPLAMLEFADFDEMLALENTTTSWDEVVIPDGPRKGENVQGYYVTMVEYYLNGSMTMKMEIWKDVRGCVPLIAYHPAGMRTDRQILVARCWCIQGF